MQFTYNSVPTARLIRLNFPSHKTYHRTPGLIAPFIEVEKQGVLVKKFWSKWWKTGKNRLSVPPTTGSAVCRSGGTVYDLVDLSVHGTNTSYLSDFIRICFKPQLLNSAEIKRFYLKEGHSAAQIAAHFGVSKSVIIGWINRLKVGSKSARGRMTNPNNFRHPNPPYGYKVKDSKLVLNNAELKICRAVVELMGRKKCGARETARELTRRGFKSRRGEVKWGHLVVQQIFKRWKDKI